MHKLWFTKQGHLSAILPKMGGTNGVGETSTIPRELRQQCLNHQRTSLHIAHEKISTTKFAKVVMCDLAVKVAISLKQYCQMTSHDTLKMETGYAWEA